VDGSPSWCRSERSDGELSVTLRQHFDLIAGTAMIDAKKKAAGEVSNGLSVNWLRR
tara:strand:+ start:452 stop:619 length:168 start_codon:yes stop_codon:yes gene_type:complete